MFKELIQRQSEHLTYLLEDQENRDQEQKLKLELYNQDIQMLLSRLEEGSIEHWWQLYIQLQRDPQQPTYPLGSIELRDTPAWAQLDAKEKQLIIDGAVRYLEEFEPDTTLWVEEYFESQIYYPAYAAIAALNLLLQENRITEISESVFEKWGPFLLLYHFQNEQKGAIPELACRGYSATPEIILRTLRRLLMHSIEGDVHIGAYRLERVKDCFDDQMGVFLFELLHEELSFSIEKEVLELLIQHNHLEALSFAQDLVISDTELERRVNTAEILAYWTSDARWELIWPAMMDDQDFAERLVGKLSDDFRYRNQSVGSKLTAQQLADLYLWLMDKFPPHEDPQERGIHVITTREEIGDWRNSLIVMLQNQATPEAIDQLVRIREIYPDLDWLVRVEAQSTRALLWGLWQAPSIEILPQLFADHTTRLISTQNQLIETVASALVAIEERLQGETPEAPFLWNIVEDNLTPKREEYLSDYLKNRLADRFSDEKHPVVLGREVRIRRRQGTKSRQGELIDVLLKTQSDSTELSLIIEIKGNWNEKLKSDMEDQLAKRYLQDNPNACGLYVVGWYSCPDWQRGDRRRQVADRYFRDLHEAKEFFDDQALWLSETTGKLIRAVVTDVSLH